MYIKPRNLAFILILFIPLFLWAQEEAKPSQKTAFEQNEEETVVRKKEFRLKNRGFELSLANIDVNLSNSFIAYNDFFQRPLRIAGNFTDLWKWDFKNIGDSFKEFGEKPELYYKDGISINIDNFLDGFKFDFGAAVKPLSININNKDKWGFGLDIGHTDVTGNISISGKLLPPQETEKPEIFGVGAAVFTDVGIPVFFHANELKIKLRPAVYLPLMYTKPGFKYSMENVNRGGNIGTRIEASYDMIVYAPITLQGVETGDFDPAMKDLQNNYWDILGNNLGYDLGFGVEFPLFTWLDLGVNVANLPFVGAKLNNYMQYKGMAFFDSSYIDLNDIIEKLGAGDGYTPPDEAWDYPKNFTPVIGHNANGVALYRPFKMVFYADYRPFDRHIISLKPSLGFSVNPLYVPKGAVEAGIDACLDLGNILVITYGINYFDRKWMNGFDIKLNFHLLELDIGFTSQSPKFVQSWRGAGLGINIGLKLGF